MANTQPEDPQSKNPARIGWLRLDKATLGGAFALTLIAAIYSYLANVPLSVPEMLFLLLAFHALVLAVKWLWGRASAARRGRT